jgi:hypothetical protein
VVTKRFNSLARWAYEDDVLVAHDHCPYALHGDKPERVGVRHRDP